LLRGCFLKKFLFPGSEGSFVAATFEGEFPKLLQLFAELWARVTVQFAADLPAAAMALCATRLRASLNVFQPAYLARSLSRLFDPVHLAFPAPTTAPATPAATLASGMAAFGLAGLSGLGGGGSSSSSSMYTGGGDGTLAPAPGADEVATMLKVMRTELAVAEGDAELAGLVAHNISKVLRLFAVKTEELLDVGAAPAAVAAVLGAVLGVDSGATRKATPAFTRDAVLVARLEQLRQGYAVSASFFYIFIILYLKTHPNTIFLQGG
jgi:hypothetical protein